MKEEMMTTGFTGGDAATGPTAGFDPVLKMRAKRKALKGLVAPGNKLSDGKKKIKENAVDKYAPKSRLFQYKVSLPEVGDTVVYASSPAELRQKLRLLINYRYRGDIEIERILPANAYKFFTDKRQKHLRNVQEAKVDKGRSDYGKASIRNYRSKGPGHGEPAMFDPENKRGKLIDKRREEHKARRGVKGAKVPAYKREDVVYETTDEKQMQRQLTLQKNQLEKKKAILKIKNIRKQLQKKTQQLKAKGRVGGNTQDYNK